MTKKITPSQIAERILYFTTIAVVPSINLFFLYNQNLTQDLIYQYFLIFSAALAVLSVVMYMLISKFMLKRRRTVILLAVSWAIFWLFTTIHGLFLRVYSDLTSKGTAVLLIIGLVIVGYILSQIKVSRYLTNVLATILCLLFLFNFIPSVMWVSSRETKRIESINTGELPYEIKTNFNIDDSLLHPNIYWLHMDGMMGFSAIEKYFDDPQTELEDYLTDKGFVVNRDARLEAGYTSIAVPAMTIPTFYDSYLNDVFTDVSQLTRSDREREIVSGMSQKGFSIADITPKNELINAFSDAGYTNFTNFTHCNLISGASGIDSVVIAQKVGALNPSFFALSEFHSLVIKPSAFSAFYKINSLVYKVIVKENTFIKGTSVEFPLYEEKVDKYISGNSDSNEIFTDIICGMKYIETMPEPHLYYFANETAHCAGYLKNRVGEVTYDNNIGQAFLIDENGNWYKERLDDPYDPKLYYPQHKYAVKQMKAQIEIILNEDPNAVIIIQGDHGIHGIGNSSDYYDPQFMYDRGYDLEAQLDLGLQVISAVRIPPQYGKLSEPLDPLDITRYLVNNFVGEDNYEYLFYKEENNND